MFHYSAKTNAFYLSDSINNYKLAGTWPDDAAEVDTETANEFMGQPPTGKVRGGDINGNPSWIDIPPPTQKEMEESAAMMKKSLTSEATREISWRQDAVDAEIATDDEVADLSAWKKYRVLLMRVDTSNPEWPETPE